MPSIARFISGCLVVIAGVALVAVPKACTPTPSTTIEADEAPPQVFRRSQPMMGTRFEIQVVSTDADEARRAIDAAFAEIDRIEALISEWQPTSEISQVNRRGFEAAVAVGPDTFEVVRRGLDLSALTDGAFDLSFAACNHLWSIKERRVPTDEQRHNCLPHIDHRAIRLDSDKRTIAFDSAHTQIGLGGIGKGYGVDRGAAVLEERGIEHFVVDGGGDLAISGRRIDRPWSVGVAHPRKQGQLLGTVSIDDGAVVTSGDYERYFERDGQRHHHIIDPTTGRAADASVAVTVVADDATTADALATALFVLGPDDGIALADRLDGVEALIIAPDLTRHRSANFDPYFRPHSP